MTVSAEDTTEGASVMGPITILQHKRIILAVTGSIAAYKAVDLASQLTQAGAQVDVIMTAAAGEFVTPLTFQSVTGRAVYDDLWNPAGGGALPTHIAHVGLGESADLLAIIPATAHTLARLAHGLADDLVSVTALAARCPLVIAPAMDAGMYGHPAVQANIDTLIERGATLIPPEEGRFASGLTGLGRLPETPTLLGHLRRVLGREGALAGRKVVVTAGGTREAIDPVRFVTNRSSGRQGYALAQAALDAGADEVALISAAEGLPSPVGADLIPVDSAEAMLEAALDHCTGADLLLMAAAVADFRPATAAQQKIKKGGADELTIKLTANPDILLEVKARRAQTGYPRVVVGFAAESENLIANTREKLARKGLDLLAANDITAADAGFSVETNRVVLLDAGGEQQQLDLASKAVIAETIIARAAALLPG
jgi:phosphopantothenoylcysteine decarboxylase / phosphopantothenate---cysteine ligase